MIIVVESNILIVPQDSGPRKERESGNKVVSDSGHTKIIILIRFYK